MFYARVSFCRQQREICWLVLHQTTHWPFGKTWSTSHSTSTGLHPTPSMHLIFMVLRLWQVLLLTRSGCTPFWTARPTWRDPPSSAQRTSVGLSQVCPCCLQRGFCCSALRTVPSGCWLKLASVAFSENYIPCAIFGSFVRMKRSCQPCTKKPVSVVEGASLIFPF